MHAKVKRGQRRVFSSEEAEEINRLYSSGVTIQSIAISYAAHHNTIRKLLIISGAPVPGKSVKITWTQERVDRVKALYAEGKSTREIANEFGCRSIGVIRRVLKINDCKLKKYKDVLKDRAKEKYIGKIPSYFLYRVFTSAARRNLEVLVTPMELSRLFEEQGGRCALTGFDLKFGESQNKCVMDTTASLDRKDSSKGYITGNVQWVHKKVNVMKMDCTDSEFLEICKAVVQEAGKRNLKICPYQT